MSFATISNWPGRIVAIAAVDAAGGLGYQQQLLFDCRRDMRFFRRSTEGQYVLAGRVTADSIRSTWAADRFLLPKRHAYVLAGGQVHQLHQQQPTEASTLFVIGGAKVYKLMLPMCHEVWLTRHHSCCARLADSYMPPLNGDFVQLASCQVVRGGSKYSFQWWRKSAPSTT